MLSYDGAEVIVESMMDVVGEVLVPRVEFSAALRRGHANGRLVKAELLIRPIVGMGSIFQFPG